jgi:hypothetical protein
MGCRESGRSGYFHFVTNAPTTTSKPNTVNLLTTESKGPDYMFPLNTRTHFREILPITSSQAVSLVTYVRDVPGLNLNRDTILTEGFMIFLAPSGLIPG